MRILFSQVIHLFGIFLIRRQQWARVVSQLIPVPSKVFSVKLKDGGLVASLYAGSRNLVLIFLAAYCVDLLTMV